MAPFAEEGQWEYYFNSFFNSFSEPYYKSEPAFSSSNFKSI